jgi:hypothetical protein
MRLIYFIVATVLISGCGGNNSNENVVTPTTSTTITTTTTTTLGQPFTTLGYSTGGGIPYTNTDPPIVKIYKNAVDFSSNWFPVSMIPYGQPLPTVNFNENFVLHAIDKTYSMDGNLIKINRVEPTSSGVTVHASQINPGKNCIFLAWFAKPYNMVSTPIFTGEATLSLTQTIVDCAPSGNGRLQLSDLP